VAAETGFKINGVIYEHPFATWDLDDAEILYAKTGLVIEDWALTPDDDKEMLARFRDPKVIRTFAAIAYWKQHKDEDFDTIYKDIVGGVTFSSIYETMFAGDVDPPASTTAPEKQSENGTVTSKESSGADSTTSSERQGSLLAPTGITG